MICAYCKNRKYDYVEESYKLQVMTLLDGKIEESSKKDC